MAIRDEGAGVVFFNIEQSHGIIEEFFFFSKFVTHLYDGALADVWVGNKLECITV